VIDVGLEIEAQNRYGAMAVGQFVIYLDAQVHDMVGGLAGVPPTDNLMLRMPLTTVAR
jgi:hypothetical protein